MKWGSRRSQTAFPGVVEGAVLLFLGDLAFDAGEPGSLFGIGRLRGVRLARWERRWIRMGADHFTFVLNLADFAEISQSVFQGGGPNG